MSRSKNSKISVITSLFNRRGHSLPDDDVIVDITGTLEDISRQVKKEAAETHLFEDNFFSPTHVMKPGAKVDEIKVAADNRKEKMVKRRRLTPDQYENIIENSLSAIDMTGQIIDRNRAITSKLKKIPA